MGLGSVLSGIGSIAGAAAGFLGSRQANRNAMDMFGQNLAFQRETFQNRYQWSMEDMRKAGLNPILAYGGGVGAGLSGSSIPSLMNEGASLESGARGVGRLVAEIENLEANTDKVKQDTSTAKAQEKNIETDTKLKQVQSHVQRQLGLESFSREQNNAQDLREKMLTMMTRIEQIMAQSRTAESRSDVAKSEATAAKQLDQLFEDFPALKPAEAIIKGILLPSKSALSR